MLKWTKFMMECDDDDDDDNDSPWGSESIAR